MKATLLLPFLAVTFGFTACSPEPTGSTAATASGASTESAEEAPDPTGAGKHVVLLAGDEEYRSEESLPMLRDVLRHHHGFKCTVLYSVNEAGEIDPAAGGSLTNPDALDTADAIVMLLRFRHWDDATTQKFEAAIQRGIPIIALRTSTHPFNYPKDSPYYAWTWNHPDGGWGERFLGETWVSHWGKHKKEATKGIIQPGTSHPILNGVSDVFGNSDVYEAHPPGDVNVLMYGKVLSGMEPDSPPADYSKKTQGGFEQPVNEPMMPVAWTREVTNDAGTTNRIFCTTMGAATDLSNEGLRRLVVNAVFWGLDLGVPKKADVEPLKPYNPTFYGFGEFKKGITPDEL